MTAREIFRRDALERRREATLRGGLARLPRFFGWLVLGGGAAAATAHDGRTAWALLVGLGGAALIVLAGPWTVYWRRDSTALSRLPIGGRTLYRVAILHAAQRAAAVALGGLIAAAPLLRDDVASFARVAALIVTAAALAPLLGPSCGVLGGALMASPEARGAMTSFAGPEGAPPTGLLPLVPVLGMGALIGALLPLVPWVRGGAVLWLPHPALAFALAGATAAIATAGATLIAPRWFRRAWLAVVALERERPIFIERSAAGPLEAGLARTLRGPYRALYLKDIAGLRRRFPASYWACGALMIALIAVGAAVHGAAAHLWSVLPLASALALYQLVLAERLISAPVEQPRLVLALPLEPRRVVASKRAYLALRVAFCVIMPATPALVRGPEKALVAGAIGLLAVAVFIGGSVRVGARMTRDSQASKAN